jgi:hypothetical protein
MEAILLTVTAQPLIHRSPLRYLAFQNIKMQGTPMNPLGVPDDPLEMFAGGGVRYQNHFLWQTGGQTCASSHMPYVARRGRY